MSKILTVKYTVNNVYNKMNPMLMNFNKPVF